MDIVEDTSIDAENLATLSAMMADGDGEREILRFLRDRPLLVSRAFNSHAWGSVHVIKEFQFGADYRADFLILSADSGAWYAHLLELESPNEKPFNGNGTPSRDLARGLAQLDEWKIWIEHHKGEFRATLASYLQAKAVPAYCSSGSDHQKAHTEVIDPRTVLYLEFTVVAGRRSHFGALEQQRRGLMFERGHRIASYDRFLDAAQPSR